MKNNTAIDVFDNWALSNKDKGMEKGHSLSVDRMIEISKNIKLPKVKNINVLDLGCGNGWMSKKLLKVFVSINYLGVDGAENMIKKAKLTYPNQNYLCVDINNWLPSNLFDLVISMEVLYYLKDPSKFLKDFYRVGVSQDGLVVIGIDHYKENTASLNWPDALDVHMQTFTINEWVDIFWKAGFSDISYEQFNRRDDWAGTLIIKAIK